MAVKKKKAKKRAVKKAGSKKRAARKAVKKIRAKKPAKGPAAKKKPAAKAKRVKENVVGIITHYFPHVQAAVIKLKGSLTNGDTIKIKGHTTDFTQGVTSMQIDRVPVTQARTGQEIGVLVSSRVRQHDLVYKV